MSNDTQSEEAFSSTLKAELRLTTINRLLSIGLTTDWSYNSCVIVQELLRYDDCFDTVLNRLSQQTNITLSSNIINMLCSHFVENDPSKKAGLIVDSVLNCLLSLFPASYTKIDMKTIQIIMSAANLMSYYSTDVFLQLAPHTANLNIVAFGMFVAYFSEEDSDLLDLLLSVASQKASFSLCTLSHFYILLKHKDLEGMPHPKVILTVLKSSTDKEVLSMFYNVVIRSLTPRINQQQPKELLPLLGHISRRITSSLDLSIFTKLIENALSNPDTLIQFKPLSESLIQLYLVVGQSLSAQAERNTDILEKHSPGLGPAMSLVLKKFALSPFETIFPSKVEMYPKSIILFLIHFLLATNPPESLREENLEPLLRQLSTVLPPDDDYLVCLCDIYVHFHSSKLAISILVKAIESGSSSAKDSLLDNRLNFDAVLIEATRALKPGKNSPTLISFLTVLLSHKISLPSAMAEQNLGYSDSAADSTTDFAKDLYQPRKITLDVEGMENNQIQSENDIYQGMESYPDQAEENESTTSENVNVNRSHNKEPLYAFDSPEASPTPQTILLCNVLSTVSPTPELISLLPLAAASLSMNLVLPSTSLSLKKLIFAFSEALQTTSIKQVLSLTSTFLLLLPGRASAFLAVCLARLPESLAKDALPKFITFAIQDPVGCGLVASSLSQAHPVLAMTLLESLIAKIPQRRKSWFILSTIQTNDAALAAAFKVIGSLVSPNKQLVEASVRVLVEHFPRAISISSLRSQALYALRRIAARTKFLPNVSQLAGHAESALLDAASLDEATAELAALTAVLRHDPSARTERAADLAAALLLDGRVDVNIVNFFFSLYSTLHESLFIVERLCNSILKSDNWKAILEAIIVVSNRMKEMKIEGSPNLLSDALSKTCSLMPVLLPIPNATSAVTSLVILADRIRSKILAVQKTVQISIGNDSSLVSLVSKRITTQQVFEAICFLLEVSPNSGVHAESCVKVARLFLRERGMEEFRLDSRIVTAIASAPKSAAAEAAGALAELVAVRPASILTVIAESDATIDIEAEEEVAKAVESSETAQVLLEVVSSALYEGKTVNVGFCLRMLQRFSKEISSCKSSVWSRLYVGVLRSSEAFDLECLVSPGEGSIAERAYKDHEGLGKELAKALKGKSLSEGVMFASIDSENCSDLLKVSLVPGADVQMLKQVFDKRLPSEFENASREISTFLIKEEGTGDIISQYLRICSTEASQMLWDEISKECQRDKTRGFKLIREILEHGAKIYPGTLGKVFGDMLEADDGTIEAIALTEGIQGPDIPVKLVNTGIFGEDILKDLCKRLKEGVHEKLWKTALLLCSPTSPDSIKRIIVEFSPLDSISDDVVQQLITLLK